MDRRAIQFILARLQDCRSGSALIGVSIVLFLLAPVASYADVFFDDFNRPDGVLGDPWTLLESYLYIESQQVVAHSDELGLMLYTGDYVWLEASCEIDVSFNGDADGDFKLFIGGGTDEIDYWGFAGTMGWDHLAIDILNPEMEIASTDYYFDSGAVYHLTLAFAYDIGEVSLVVEDGDGQPVVSIATAASEYPYQWCAIGIENQLPSDKWLDNATFTTNGTICPVPPDPDPLPTFSCYPNPFNPQTRVSFDLDSGQLVSIDIFDLSGRRVVRLLDGYLAAQQHTVDWNGCDAAGRAVSSGSYFVQLRTSAGARSQKVMLAR